MIESLAAAASILLPAVRSDVRHKQELHHAETLHAAEAAHARRLLDDKLTHKAHLFSTESILATRRHALGMEVARSLSRREALRDAWQQRSWFLQTMVLTVSLIFSVVFVALTQGRVAEIAQSLFTKAVGRVQQESDGTSQRVNVALSHSFGAHVWMGSMGVSIACLFVALWLCLLVQRRVGRYRVLPSLADAGSHGAVVARAGGGVPKSVAGRRTGVHSSHHGETRNTNDNDLLSASGNFDDLLSSPGRGGGGGAGGDDASVRAQHRAITGADDDDDDDVFSIPSPQQQQQQQRQSRRQQPQHMMSNEAVAAGLLFTGGDDEPADYASAAAGEAIVDDVAVDDEVRSVVDYMMHDRHAAGQEQKQPAQQRNQPAKQQPPGGRGAVRGARRFETSSPEDPAAVTAVPPPGSRPLYRRGPSSPDQEEEDDDAAAVVGSSSTAAYDDSSPFFSGSATSASPASPGAGGGVLPPGSATTLASGVGSATTTGVTSPVIVQLRDVAGADIARHLQGRGPTALENDDGRGDGGADKDSSCCDEPAASKGKKQRGRQQQQQPAQPTQQVHFRYSCGHTHSDFNGYYICHCESLRRAASALLALGTSAAIVAAAALHAMLMVDVFWHPSPAIIAVVLVGLGILVGAVSARVFPDELLESADTNGDFMGLAEKFAAASAASASSPLTT